MASCWKFIVNKPDRDVYLEMQKSGGGCKVAEGKNIYTSGGGVVDCDGNAINKDYWYYDKEKCTEAEFKKTKDKINSSSGTPTPIVVDPVKPPADCKKCKMPPKGYTDKRIVPDDECCHIWVTTMQNCLLLSHSATTIGNFHTVTHKFDGGTVFALKSIGYTLSDIYDGFTLDDITVICDKCLNDKAPPPPVIPPPPPQQYDEPNWDLYHGRGGLGENIKRKKVIKEDYSNLSDEEFWKKIEEFKCLPEWLESREYKANAGISPKDNKTILKGMYGVNREDDNEFLFTRNYTAINLTNPCKTWNRITNRCEEFSVKTWYCKKMEDFVYTPSKGLKRQDILNKYGIQENYGEELINEINQVTSQIQEYLNMGAISPDFIPWHEFLQNNYLNDERVTKLVSKTGGSLDRAQIGTIYNKDRLAREFEAENAKDLLGWDATIYLPIQLNENYCKEILKNYLINAFKYAGKVSSYSPANIEQRKDRIRRCNAANFFQNVTFKKEDLQSENPNMLSPFNYLTKGALGLGKSKPKYGDTLEWEEIKKYLQPKENGKYTGENLLPSEHATYGIYFESKLKNKIKSALNEVVTTKRKEIVEEQLVKTRVETLFENVEFSSRKQRKDFVVNLLKETLYLDSQIKNKKLINEEFWDVMKGFFGEEGSSQVFKSFKTRMSEWLTSHLSPKKKDGWVGNCIKKTIQDMDISDVHHITNCDFLTREISKSIIQKLDEKMSNEELKDDGIYDIVRGGMKENVKGIKFKKHVEGKVKQMICPILYDMSNRFDDSFEEMKKRAVKM